MKVIRCKFGEFRLFCWCCSCSCCCFATVALSQREKRKCIPLTYWTKLKQQNAFDVIWCTRCCCTTKIDKSTNQRLEVSCNLFIFSIHCQSKVVLTQTSKERIWRTLTTLHVCWISIFGRLFSRTVFCFGRIDTRSYGKCITPIEPIHVDIMKNKAPKLKQNIVHSINFDCTHTHTPLLLSIPILLSSQLKC